MRHKSVLLASLLTLYLLGLWLLPGPAVRTVHAQGTPNCSQALSFGSATPGTAINTISGAQAGCAGWRLTWSVTGFTAATIQLEGSQDNSSWSAFSGATIVLEGSNPTSWTSATASNTIVVRASQPYVRVNITGVTGSGTIKTLILGYSGTSAQLDNGSGGGGGSCGALGGDLSGTCAAATVIGVNGASVPASQTCIGTNSSSQLITGTCGGAGTGGGGFPGYSANVSSASITGGATVYFAPSGGGPLSATETSVEMAAPYTASGSSFYVQLSVALGTGNTGVFTIRDNAAATSVTCTISGSSATSCNDVTHSFNGTKGDLIDIQGVFTGTISVSPNLMMSFSYGQSVNTSVLTTSLPGGTIGTGTNKNLSISSGATVTLFDYLGSKTVSTLPAAASSNLFIATVTDGTTATDCTTGGGSNKVLCQSNGSAWGAIGSPGSSTGGYLSEFFIASNQYSVAITVTVDGEGTPAINAVNIADLLGDNYADTQPSAWNRWLAVSNNGSGNPGGTLKLPIPFSSSVVVTAKNNAGGTAVITDHIIGHFGITQSWVYAQHLHVALTNTSGIAANAETNMLNISPGKAGQLAGVGWIEDSFPGSASPATAPLEGAFKIYVDGSATASYATSGSEDFFGAPWYFRNVLAFGSAAATGSNLLAPQSADISITIEANSPVTFGAQRFFIEDPITFNSALRFSWICGNTGAVSFTGTCKLISTVYYYQAP